MKPFRLNRRTFLGGAGTLLGLPLLEAMIPIGRSAFAATDSPTRLLAYYVPCGIHMQAWTPAQTGSDYQLSPTLAPLAKVRQDVLVLTNLANRPAKPDGPGDHAAGTGSFITATHVRKTEGDDILNGISLDQWVARERGHLTPLPSLELGMDGGGSAGNCDSGYSCAYARNIAWSGPQTPVPKLTEPQRVFDRLFAGFDTSQTALDRQRRAALNQSVLDYVLSDIRRMQQKLGAADRAKLEEYFTSVEQLERQLVDAAPSACTVPDRPAASGLSLTAKARLMADLMVLAFQCDLTRVQTFMLANAGSNRRYDFLGIDQGHHELSHHQNLQTNYDKLKIIDHWEVQQFAYLLEKLKSTVDGDGKSLLDTATVFFSSEISDGNRHNHTDMPILLAGRANGYFATGRHIRYSKEQPVANLFISMLDAMGLPVQTFGDDGTGTLPELGV